MPIKLPDLDGIMKARLLALICLLALALPAFAVEPDEMLQDPALEARACAVADVALHGLPE